MKKIGFTGTQEGMSIFQYEQFKFLLSCYEPGELHHGDCIGADAQANDAARFFGWRTVAHPPIKKSKRAFCRVDESREPKEYLVRNHDIVDETETLIAAPFTDAEQQRSGTWATIRYAKKVNKIGYIMKREKPR